MREGREAAHGEGEEMVGRYRRKGILCVVSGPSGSGKTSLCRSLSGRGECVYSVSCTTRKAREGEVDGTDYHFLSEEEFEEKEARGEFLEHARVHDRRYGTLKSSIVEELDRGVDVVMDIDVQGAAQVRRCADDAIRAAVVDVFVLPPTLEELRKRLAGRGTESDEEIAFRLANAREEMRHWREYQYTIVSGKREDDLSRLEAILAGERCRSTRIRPPAGVDYLTNRGSKAE